jgi:uncharacterized membrane protein
MIYPQMNLARQSRNQRISTKLLPTKSFSVWADLLRARKHPDKDDLFMILSVMILSKTVLLSF